MSAKNTPTTDAVWNAATNVYSRVSLPGFDRWLAAHDRAQFAAGVAAARETVVTHVEAWRMGWESGSLVDAILSAIDALQEDQ